MKFVCEFVCFFTLIRDKRDGNKSEERKIAKIFSKQFSFNLLNRKNKLTFFRCWRWRDSVSSKLDAKLERYKVSANEETFRNFGSSWADRCWQCDESIFWWNEFQRWRLQSSQYGYHWRYNSTWATRVSVSHPTNMQIYQIPQFPRKRIFQFIPWER